MTISPKTPAAKEAVDTLLGLAQLRMEEEEYEQLLRLYAQLREPVAALRIPEVRYGEPAVVYSMLPR